MQHNGQRHHLNVFIDKEWINLCKRDIKTSLSSLLALATWRPSHVSSAFCPLSCWKCAGKGQRSVLTGLGVRVAITLSAAVRWGLFVVLFLREAQGQRLGGAGTAVGLLLSKPAVTAALLRAVWEVKGHAALRLLKYTHTHTQTHTQQSSWADSGFRLSERNRRLHFEYLFLCIRVTALDLQLFVF